MHATVVIVGAGQAGLAMSRCLTDRSIDHVLLERGGVANSWSTERWDSLCLLTPNWMTRLPGFSAIADDPSGYESAREVAARLKRYADEFRAPVHEGITVTSVTHDGEHFVTDTDHGSWTSNAVVVATGACSTPSFPSFAADLPDHITQLSPIHYRRPSDLPDGDVLVAGASASGVQLADELLRHGRNVTVAVGKHTRIPRTYRGRDILWWMNELGWLDQTIDQFEDLDTLRRAPSMQLVGSPDRRTLDLNALAANGASVAGRFVSADHGIARFDDTLAQSCAAADLAMFDLVSSIEKFVADHGLATELPDAEELVPTSLPTPPSSLPLDRIGTVIWATGFRPNTPWLDSRWLDERGAIVHHGGVVDPLGLYALGLPFLRRRKSNFIDGVGPDARDLSEHLAATLVASSST